MEPVLQFPMVELTAALLTVETIADHLIHVLVLYVMAVLVSMDNAFQMILVLVSSVQKPPLARMELVFQTILVLVSSAVNMKFAKAANVFDQTLAPE
jgi:hypothetical protein